MIVPLVTSVNMPDYLAVTLPKNRTFFESFVVVTSPDDAETHAVCREHDARIIVYDDFHADGSRFNKSGAIRHAQRMLHREHPHAWILLMDTDIVLPDTFDDIAAAATDTSALYGIERDDILDDGTEEKYAMPFVGYFQLYFDKTRLYAPHSMDASVCDWKFMMQFPRRILLAPRPVVVTHIGKSALHWNGRTSPPLLSNDVTRMSGRALVEDGG